MPSKPENHISLPLGYARRKPLSTKNLPIAVFLCLLLLCAGVLAMAIPFSAHATGTSSKGQKPASSTPAPAVPTEAAGYSDAPQPKRFDPSMTGGPDAGGYVYADNRDAGGPVYDYRVPVNSARVADSEWQQVGQTTYSALDDGVVTRTLPFPFTFYGTSYTQVHISTNGNIHFGAPNASFPGNSSCLPSNSSSVPRAMVAPLWFDFVVPEAPTSTAGVYIGTEGLGTSQTYIVEWRDVLSPATGLESVRATFQVIISASGDITFQYKNLNGPGTYGSGGVIGIQNAGGSVGLQYGPCNHQDVLAVNRAIRYRVLQDVAFQPDAQAKGGAPGAMLTYTGTLANLTGAGNSFTLTVAGNNWTTVVTPTNTGTLANGASVPVTASVQIPAGASLGASDVATVTASSTLPTPGQFTATWTLSSSVTTNGIDFSPVNPSRSGDYGSTVTYGMRLYNRTGQSNSFQLDKSSSAWATSLAPTTTGSVPNDGYVPVTVTVSVPANATLGMQDVVRVSASSQMPSPGSFFGVQVITTTAGIWRVQADMLQPRSRAAAVSYGSNGQIYVLGGETEGGVTDLPVEQYDSLGNQWYARATLSRGAANAGAAAIGNAIYVPGGSTLFGVQNTLRAYYPDSNRAEVIQSDPLPEARFGAGVTALNGRLFVIGGADASQVARNTVFEYDPNRPAGSRWQQRSPMPTARVYLGAASVDGVIYAAGGVSRVVQPIDLATVEAYNPGTDTWTTLTSMSRGRGGLALVGVNTGDPGCGGRLYALGGGYASPVSTAELYDPSTGTWRAVSSLALARRTLAAAYSPVTKSLVVMGGWSGNQVSETEAISCTGGVTYCTVGFPDVPPDNTFYPYTRCLGCRGVLGGFSDGTFRPGNPVTRGQLSKIVSNAAGFAEDPTTQTYEDVPTSGAFYIWVERLSSRGVIGGYPCGGPDEPCVAPGNRPYFRPNANSSRGQITKIVANAANFNDTIRAGTQTFSDVAPSSPFWVFVERLAARGVMSGYLCGSPGELCDAQNRPYFRPNANASRGQVSKIVSNTFFPECGNPARSVDKP